MSVEDRLASHIALLTLQLAIAQKQIEELSAQEIKPTQR